MAEVIALDAMGGDFAPQVTVDGALRAAAEGIQIALVGDSEVLGRELNARGGASSALRLVHAPDVVAMGDKAAREVRRQRQTSMYVGTELVRDGEASAFVTMGNTGAAMATALVVLGRIPGYDRPALGCVLPTLKGTPVMFLDVGANADARSAHLVQFARMASAYMRAVYSVPEPRVALLSIGEESSKGSMLVTETHELLARDTRVNFTGNVESRELMDGTADVIVTDGFTGNVSLKLAEGIAGLIFDQLRDAAQTSLRNRIGAGLLLPSLRSIRERMDYRVYGAVPLLGVRGGVFIGHGRSDSDAVVGALRTAQQAIRAGMLTALEDSSER